MKSKFSLVLTGMGYMLSSFSIIASQTTLPTSSLSKDSASLSKDWRNVGNSIRRGISEYETSKEYAGKRKK